MVPLNLKHIIYKIYPIANFFKHSLILSKDNFSNSIKG
jgi:hypothetical protein